MWCSFLLLLLISIHSLNFIHLFILIYLIPFDFGVFFFFLQIFVSTGLGVNVNFLIEWILQTGLSIARQLFDLYYPFLIIIIIVVWNVKLYYFIFLFVYRGQERGTPYIWQNSCKCLFLPSFVKLYFFYRRIARAIIG